ncbi:hypothetical protein MFIFM68171_04983 [Madurella fahalii]|uniref:Uncharacterized protein n=1 Tax=Madurella fahalii TaxID=1157608 RepID=A0ABQ0GAH7_9PEZI
MRGFSLRQLPTRPAPTFNPVIEAWLDSLPPPAAKPSRKELRQWRLRNVDGLGKDFFITSILIRSISFVLATAVAGIVLSIVVGESGPQHALERLLPALIVCPITALWGVAEFITACFLRYSGIRNKGIPPDIHVWVDVALFLGVATATGLLLVDIIIGICDYGAYFDPLAEEIASACLLVFLMIVHSFLLFFYVCNSLDRRHKTRRERVAGLRLPDADAISPPLGATGSRTVPEFLNLDKFATSIHLNDLDPSPTPEQPRVRITSFQLTPTERSAASPSPHSPLSQAPTKVWNGEAGGAIRATLPRKPDDTIHRNAAHQTPSYANATWYC